MRSVINIEELMYNHIVCMNVAMYVIYLFSTNV